MTTYYIIGGLFAWYFVGLISMIIFYRVGDHIKAKHVKEMLGFSLLGIFITLVLILYLIHEIGNFIWNKTRKYLRYIDDEWLRKGNNGDKIIW